MLRKKKQYTFGGSVYSYNGRYYWKVKLPGTQKRRTISLRKSGHLATTNETVAYEIAQRMWDAALSVEGGDHQKVKTVGDLIASYRAYCIRHYPKTSDMPYRIKCALDLIDCTDIPAGDFGPNLLRKTRDKMIGKGLSETIINERAGFIRKMFEWAAGREIVGPDVPYALKFVESVMARDDGVNPAGERQPVDIEIIKKTLPYLSNVVRSMVRVQFYTGMRPKELVKMKPRNIDTSADIWIYRPDENKNTWREKKGGKKYNREIAIGKRAQEVLIPFLAGCRQDQYLFRPEDALAERIKSGASHAKRERYNKDTYRRAIERACSRAFPVPDNLKDDKEKSKKWKKDHQWTPYQIRHTIATKIRSMFGDNGLTTSQVFLGQRSIEVAEIYAKANQNLIVEAVKSIDNQLEL